MDFSDAIDWTEGNRIAAAIGLVWVFLATVRVAKDSSGPLMWFASGFLIVQASLICVGLVNRDVIVEGLQSHAQAVLPWLLPCLNVCIWGMVWTIYLRGSFRRQS